MLDKKRRIKSELFKKAQKYSAKTFHSDNFTLKVAKNPEKSESKFAFVVSGKVSSKAVDRNRLKRRGFSALRGFSDNVRHPLILIFYVKKSALNLKFSQFKDEIVELLRKSGVFDR